MKTSLLEQLSVTAEGLRRAKGGGLLLSGPSATVGLPAAPKQYLYHGWQSWSLAAWVDASRRLPVMRPSILHPMQTDPRYAREQRPNGAWYGAVEMENGQVVFLGALGLDSHVILDGAALIGHYEHGRGEWFVAAGDESEVMARYAALLGERLGRGRAARAPRVWCSWYSLYTGIDERRLLKVLGDLDGLPFEVFQVDDGWQVGIGDWEANPRFPSGMDGLAARIRAAGFTPGLWLAPLLVVPSSRLYREHRDWLLHDEQGRLVSAGFNWGEQLHALDTSHPEALDWLAALMKRVRAWGYDYAKLDFLYAGALPGKRRQDMPREAAYRRGLEVIREALGEAYFLTCGAPILPSLGLCDGLRVGPDVHENWENRRDSILLGNFTTPGTRNAIRTSLHRLWLGPLVHTDPDVAYFRSQQINLSPEQKSLLQDLARISGFKATSDLPSWLTEEQRAALQKFLQDKSRVEKTGRYTYRIGKREVDFSQAVRLPPPPKAADNARGVLLGWLGNLPAAMRLLDRIGRRALRKTLAKNPV